MSKATIPDEAVRPPARPRAHPRLVAAHGPRRRPLPPVADDRRTIGFLISDVARMMRSSFDRRVRRIGLTRPQWLVLSLLHHRPGVSQTELAEMLEVERAVAGRMIDRLERRRWVVRRPDPADRRVKRLFLTAEARGVQAEMGRIAEEMLDDAMALLGDGEREALTEMLERVKARLQAMGPPRPAGTDAAPDPAAAAAVP